MPYAIFSKRTRILNRIVEDLGSLLPSESMIEVDDEINYPRLTKSLIQGQNINSMGWPLFLRDGYPDINPTYVDKVTDVDGRPFTVKNPPVFVQPQIPGGGGQQTQYVDINLKSHPFGWTANELAQVKYETILSQNHPYQAVVGEEWESDDHINIGSSSGFFLSEGQCWLAPQGQVYTTYFTFNYATSMDPTAAQAADEAQSTMPFDTYYLTVAPDLPTGVKIEWSGIEYGSGDAGTDVGWSVVKLSEETPTTKLGTAETTARILRSIRLRFTNQTSSVIPIENYALFIRSRNNPLT